MVRYGNMIARRFQGDNLISVGVDMGGELWATAIHDWSTGQDRYFALRDKEGKPKEQQLYEKIAELVAVGREVEVFYEAGRYGFTPAREMMELGAHVTILPVNKLKVIMPGKVLKTDKLDALFLAGLHPADKLPAVYIPTPSEEALRDAERELTRLRCAINQTNSRMLSIVERLPLEKVGGHLGSPSWLRWVECQRESGALGKIDPFVVHRLQNMVEELQLFERQLERWLALVAKRLEEDRAAAAAAGRTATFDVLTKFKGIGANIARRLCWEIGDFGRFRNGKAFASYFGLTPCPFASGTMNRDLGISKAGRRSLRSIMVEAAWLWARWQPDSRLTMKWKSRLEQKGRTRKTAIVALARQLLVALWRHVVRGAEIEGAKLVKR